MPLAAWATELLKRGHPWAVIRAVIFEAGIAHGKAFGLLAAAY